MTFARPKPARERSKAHLEFIRQLPCIACACEGRDTPERSVDAAHVSYLGQKGFGSKVSDFQALPLCRSHHDEQHAGNERLFWARLGINPGRLTGFLVACEGDVAAGRGIILTSADERARPHRLVKGGELPEAIDAAPKRVTILAHLTGDTDAFGNVAVLLPVLDARGCSTARAFADPSAVFPPTLKAADGEAGR